MGIYWKNKIKIIFVLVALSMFSCKSKKITTSSDIIETRDRTEVITKTNPYRLESISTLNISKLGVVEPTVLKLNIGETVAEVSIKDNEVTYSLENKDTIITNNIVDKVNKEKSTTKTESKELTWWGKLKKKINTIAIYSLILNIVFIAYKINRFLRRIYLPI